MAKDVNLIPVNKLFRLIFLFRLLLNIWWIVRQFNSNPKAIQVRKRDVETGNQCSRLKSLIITELLAAVKNDLIRQSTSRKKNLARHFTDLNWMLMRAYMKYSCHFLFDLAPSLYSYIITWIHYIIIFTYTFFFLQESHIIFRLSLTFLNIMLKNWLRYS